MNGCLYIVGVKLATVVNDLVRAQLSVNYMWSLANFRLALFSPPSRPGVPAFPTLLLDTPAVINSDIATVCFYTLLGQYVCEWPVS